MTMILEPSRRKLLYCRDKGGALAETKKVTELERLKADQRSAYRHLAYVVREFLNGAGIGRAELAAAIERVDRTTEQLARRVGFGSPSY